MRILDIFPYCYENFDWHTQFKQGLTLLKDNQVDKALKHFRNCKPLLTKTDYAKQLFFLAMREGEAICFEYQNQYSFAYATYEKIDAVFEERIPKDIGIENRVRILFLKAKCQLIRYQFQAAKLTINKIKLLLEGIDDLNHLEPFEQVLHGVVLCSENKLADARMVFENVIYLSERYLTKGATAVFCLGIATHLDTKKEYKDALPYLEKAIKLFKINGIGMCEKVQKEALIDSLTLKTFLLEKMESKVSESTHLEKAFSLIKVNKLIHKKAGLYNELGQAIARVKARYLVAIWCHKQTIRLLNPVFMPKNHHSLPQFNDSSTCLDKIETLAALKHMAFCYYSYYLQQTKDKTLYLKRAFFCYEKAIQLIELIKRDINIPERTMELMIDERGCFEDAIAVCLELAKKMEGDSQKNYYIQKAFLFSEQSNVGLTDLVQHKDSNKLAYNQDFIQKLYAQLAPATTLIKYFFGHTKSYIFYLSTDSKNKVGYKEINTKSLEIEEDIKKLREAISHRITYKKEANYLYSLLLEPIKKYLLGKQQLIFIPDIYSLKLPFEVLPAVDFTNKKEKNDFMIQSHEIIYHYSSRLFLRNNHQEKSIKEPSALIFAPSKFLDNNIENLTCITSTKAFRLHRIAMKLNTLIEEKADRKNFIKAVENHDFIMILTHGYESSFETGFYTHKDILRNTDLRNINCKSQLVILSCCKSDNYSRFTRTQKINMNQAFIAAGALNVVCSLFMVMEDAARTLINSFCTYTFKGETYAAALRKAKLKLIKDETMGVLDWCPFVLYGNGLSKAA